MRRFWRNYSLEVEVAAASFIITASLFFFFRVALRVSKDDFVFVSVVNAGFLFVVGHVYSRLKERRDNKRRRAQELFIEWHKEIRESRIFVSRWIDTHPGDPLPSLRRLEIEAALAYRQRYDRALVLPRPDSSEQYSPKLHALDDPEQKELHFFRIYQFFERWALLVLNSDIDQESASEYMRSYKRWYIDKFILPWVESKDNDEYIALSLRDIVNFVVPDR